MVSKLRIADIQTEDILYYDAVLHNKCFEFCQQRDIDCLPSQDDPSLIHIRDDNAAAFDAVPVTEDRKIDASQNAFHPEVVKAFERNHVLLVHANRELSGVVHFSDYSRPAVSIYLYELFFQYERSLRVFLRAQGLENDNMLEFFQSHVERDGRYRSKIGAYQNRIVEHEKKPEFQGFYLDDLIGLANESGNIALDTQAVKLRNMVMHAHELVDMEDWHTDDLVYDFKSFRRFFALAAALHTDFRKVKNRIVLLAGV